MLRNPTNQQRVIILGRTGTGKSQFAVGLQSTRNFTRMPWTIIDYKGEDLWQDILEATNGAIKQISVEDKPPTKPGLYYLRPRPQFDDEYMNRYLYRIWETGHHGLNIDEGYALPQGRKDVFDLILTQGRSLHIPVIVLYQRPSWMSRFAVAQSDYRCCFALDDLRDYEVAAKFIPPVKGPNNELISVSTPLPPYHCVWYDVSQGVSTVLQPAPARDEIIDAFIHRLRPVKRKALI